MISIILKGFCNIFCQKTGCCSEKPCCPSKQCSQTLFERIGGQNAVNIAVDKFYERVLADPRVKHFFKNTNMTKQRQSQKDFITTVLGGPNVYKGKDMYEAHKGMNLTDKDFDAIVDNLVKTLRELRVDEQAIKEIGDILETVRNPTLGRKSLFERIGGQEAINLAVDQFYKKVLADSRVNQFFKNTDMKKQHQMQKDFITTVLGGPQVYKGKDMREAHKHMKITDFEFNVIVELLVKTLQELGVDSGIIADIAPLLESLRNDTCNKQSIYERIGGKDAIDAAVDKFYVKVLADNRVKHYFAKTNMTHQRQMQKDFLTTAFGGPNIYKGKDMKAAHKGMGLSNKEFDAIVELLAQTLKELGVSDSIIGEIAALVEPLRKEVNEK